jgi:hypothetical protein
VWPSAWSVVIRGSPSLAGGHQPGNCSALFEEPAQPLAAQLVPNHLSAGSHIDLEHPSQEGTDVPPTQFDLLIPHKALFAPHAIKQALANDQYPPAHEGALKRLQRWQMLLADENQRDRMNEESYKAEFLRDIFDSLLGYRTVGSSPVYNMRREVHGSEDDRPADAVLGFLGELDPEMVRVVVEVKPPGARLDARQASRRDRLSPVDQGFLYAKEFEDVRWVIVTNFDEFRLYNHRRGATAYESFVTSRVIGGELHRFSFLLRRDNLIGDGEGPSRTEQLAEETWREQAQISKRFYEQYQEARLALFEELRAQNPGVTPLDVLRATQTLLDRLLFILFCKSRGLLPHAVLSQLRRLADTESVYYRPNRSSGGGTDSGVSPSQAETAPGGAGRSSLGGLLAQSGLRAEQATEGGWKPMACIPAAVGHRAKAPPGQGCGSGRRVERRDDAAQVLSAAR